MSSQDAIGATREALTSLAAAVVRVRDEYGDTLGTRRLASDVDRLRTDLDELGDPRAGHPLALNPEDRLEISDDPYDESMWQDAESDAQHAL